MQRITNFWRLSLVGRLWSISGSLNRGSEHPKFQVTHDPKQGVDFDVDKLTLDADKISELLEEFMEKYVRSIFGVPDVTKQAPVHELSEQEVDAWRDMPS